jgi:inorganic pyrophosphatase
MRSPDDDRSLSLALAQRYLGRQVRILVDRPLGSSHPLVGFRYGLNYGYVPGTRAPDGEELDAYLVGVEGPVEEFTGTGVAVIHRLDDDDDKLVVVPVGTTVTEAELAAAVEFQERVGHYEIRWA